MTIDPLLTDVADLTRLKRVERTMTHVRWGALAFGLFQLYQYTPIESERVGAPSKGLWIAVGLSLLAAFALGNGAVALWITRVKDLALARKVSVMTTGLDLVVTIGFVLLFTFDAGNAIWVILYVIPLEGALRFQLKGSLIVMAIGTVAYTASRYWGHVSYGHDFLPFSITFRMGIGMMIAIIAGFMSKNLLAERNRLRALHESTRSLASSLKTSEILENLSVAAKDGVGAEKATVHLGSALPVESDRVMTIPIEGRNGEILGVLASHFDRKPKLSADQRPFLGSLANAAAIALENAQLYEQVEAHSLELEERVLERTLDLEEARLEILRRLALAAEFRDYETGEHTARVGTNSARLAEAAGITAGDIEILRRAAPLHDVGKIGVSDTILLKPGRLTDEERQAMQRHTRIGADILSGSSVPLLQMAEQIAFTHHERWDGAGYEGMQGESIPLFGRIVAIADVFDALTHSRPYKEAWTVSRATNELLASKGSHFDPYLVDLFTDLVRRGLIHAAA